MSQKNQPARREQTRVEAMFHGQSFSGPLPHPDLLIEYNNAVPDAAERILRMAETQAAHRQDIERRVVRSNTLNQAMGTIFAFLTIIGALASLVTVFIKGRSAQDRERREKQQALALKK